MAALNFKFFILFLDNLEVLMIAKDSGNTIPINF